MKKLLVLLLLIPTTISYGQIKLSQLGEATNINSTDLFLLTQGAASKKLQFSTLQYKLFNNIPYPLRLNYSSDTLRLDFSVDSTRFFTSNPYYIFNKTVKAPLFFGTASNSNLLQGKDSTYIKANWGNTYNFNSWITDAYNWNDFSDINFYNTENKSFWVHGGNASDNKYYELYADSTDYYLLSYNQALKREAQLQLKNGKVGLFGRGADTLTGVFVDSISMKYDKDYSNRIKAAPDSMRRIPDKGDVYSIINRKINFQDDIFDWSTNKYTPYLSQQAFLSFDNSTTDPTRTDRLNLNGKAYATSFNVNAIPAFANAYYFNSSTTYSTGLSGTADVPISVTALSGGSSTMKGAQKVLDLQQYGSAINITASFPVLSISRSQAGSVDVASSLLDLTDNSTTSGAITSPLIKGVINNTTRVLIYPRATGSTTPFVLKSHNTVTGNLFEIYQQDRLKLAIDSSGYIKNNSPHATSVFYDSTIVITLSQNTWYQITRQSSHNSWPESEYIGFTSSNDTTIFSYAGDAECEYLVNLQSSDVKDYEYRLLRKRGATTTALDFFQVTGTGTKVRRQIKTYATFQEGDKIWVELRSTSEAPGSITIFNGVMIVKFIHLD